MVKRVQRARLDADRMKLVGDLVGVLIFGCDGHYLVTGICQVFEQGQPEIINIPGGIQYDGDLGYWTVPITVLECARYFWAITSLANSCTRAAP